MTSTAHALVGAAIVQQIPDLRLSLPLAFLSHYVLDKVPHWDPLTDKDKSLPTTISEEVALLITGYSLVFLIFIWQLHAANPAAIFLGSTVSILPDWFEFPYQPFHVKVPFVYENYRFQKWIHDLWFDARLKAPWGLVPQTLIVLLFLSWVFLFPTHP